jgi:hypothetical protein
MKDRFPDLDEKTLLLIEQTLREAFYAGWMRANSLNYSEEFFEHFKNTHDWK